MTAIHTGIIRPAMESELDRVLAVLLMLNQEESNLRDARLALDEYQFRNLEERVRMVLSDPDMGKVYFYETDRELVGLIWGYVDSRVGYISDIWISPRFRGTPLAVKLYRALAGYFVDRHVRCINACASSKNSTVRRMLAKLGFEEMAVGYQIQVEPA